MGIVLDLSPSALDMHLYGSKAEIVSNYLYNQMQALPKVFNEFSQRVYNNLNSSYQFVNDRLTQYGVLNELQDNKLSIIDNYYEELLTFQRLQNANLTMQRWVMAHPQIKEMYVNQNLDGYSETYKNVFGKELNDKDYNYRLVMDGVITSTDDKIWSVKNYITDLLPGDKELTHFEKSKILNTWQAIDFMLNSDWDFTCKSTESVKFNKE